MTFLDKTNSKAFADDKLNAAVLMISLFDRIENTVGKGDQQFSLFFFHSFCPGIIENWDSVVMD